MKQFEVTIKHSIRATFSIEAVDLESAKEKALQLYHQTPTDELDFDWQNDDEVVDWSELDATVEE